MSEKELMSEFRVQLRLEKAIQILEEVKPELNRQQKKSLEDAIRKIEYAFNIYGGGSNDHI